MVDHDDELNTKGLKSMVYHGEQNGLPWSTMVSTMVDHGKHHGTSPWLHVAITSLVCDMAMVQFK